MIDRSEQTPSLQTYRFRLTVLTLAFFFVFKLMKLSGEPFALIFSTWSFEACVGLWIFALTAMLGQVKLLERLRVPQVLFAGLYLVHYLLCFFTAYFFHDALVRKYSLLDMGADAVAYLFSQVAPWRGTALCAGVLVALCLVALAARRVRMPGRPAPLLATLMLVSLLVWSNASLAKQFPTPLWDLALDLDEVRQHPSIARPGTPRPPHDVALLDRASTEPVQLKTRYTKVLVFVMESVTLRHFLDSRADMPEENFFRRVKTSAHFYSNVFANDMDSRTGLLALLTSRFIPYEAYKDPDMDHYRRVGDKRSMVDVMRDNGYFAAIGTAQVIGEGIVSMLHWDDRLVMTEAETKAKREQYLCFNPYRFEDSCEDKVLLPRLFDLLDAHEKLFWVQQLVWGHLPDYSRVTKKSDVQYYGELLDLVVEHLKEKGQLDDTLIVVTADHGIRERGTETLPSTYRIPLLLWSSSSEARENVDLHAQIDFKDIVVAGLEGTESEVKGDDFAVFMGPTYSSIFGAVTKQHDFMVLKNRPSARYVLQLANIADEERLTAPKGEETPYEFLSLLDDYRRYFMSPEFR